MRGFIALIALLMGGSACWASKFVMPFEFVVKTSPFILIAKIEKIASNEVNAVPVKVLKGDLTAPLIKIRFPDGRPLKLSRHEVEGGLYLIYLDPSDAGYYTFHPYRLSNFQQVMGNSITSGPDRKLVPLPTELERIAYLIKTPLHEILDAKTNP